jgi:acyl-coenzyme A thioesterase PaaI-like protein
MRGGVEDKELSLYEDLGCFGCSPTNPVGLRLRFWRRDDRVYTRYQIPEHYHGAPGIAHGGIVAAILDELSCVAALAIRKCYVVTGEISVRYSRPCPVDVELEISARVAEQEHPRYLVIEAEAHKEDVLLARSTGRFFPQMRAESAP